MPSRSGSATSSAAPDTGLYGGVAHCALLPLVLPQKPFEFPSECRRQAVCVGVSRQLSLRTHISDQTVVRTFQGAAHRVATKGGFNAIDECAQFRIKKPFKSHCRGYS